MKNFIHSLFIVVAVVLAMPLTGCSDDIVDPDTNILGTWKSAVDYSQVDDNYSYKEITYLMQFRADGKCIIVHFEGEEPTGLQEDYITEYNWSLHNKKLTIGETTYKIDKLNATELVYNTTGNFKSYLMKTSDSEIEKYLH